MKKNRKIIIEDLSQKLLTSHFYRCTFSEIDTNITNTFNLYIWLHSFDSGLFEGWRRSHIVTITFYHVGLLYVFFFIIAYQICIYCNDLVNDNLLDYFRKRRAKKVKTFHWVQLTSTKNKIYLKSLIIDNECKTMTRTLSNFNIRK